MTVFAINRRGVLASLSTAATLAAIPGGRSLAAATRDPRVSQAETIADALFSASNAPGLSVAVANAGATLWRTVRGRTNLELDAPTDPAHIFRLGSVSKLLTAVLAARLVSRGTIDLDRPISTWMAGLPAHHRQTTLRQLLTHRGGVRHYNAGDFDVNGPGGAIYMRLYPTRQNVLDLFINDPLVAPAGTQVSYSSYGFTLASFVMEDAAGRDFVDMIKTEIGVALGLSSLIEDDPFAITPMRATGYMNPIDVNILYGMVPEAARPKLIDGFANSPPSNPAYCWAGAGFLATTEDIARFGAAMIDAPGSAITPAERSLLFTPMTEATRASPPLGLAWRVDTDAKGRLRWHHAGATPGGRFALVVYPDQGVSIALASNVMSTPGDVLRPSSDLADVFAAA